MVLQKAINIAGEVLDTNLDVDFKDFGNDWHQVALLHLMRSRQTLAGIKFLAAEQFFSPAETLCRHLFELAVNIRYLSIDPVNRVPDYLEHYRVRASSESLHETDAKLQSLREQENHAEISKLLIRGRSWMPLKNMCAELGWLGQYETIYRGSSEMAHGGARTIGLEMAALVSDQPMLQYVVSNALLKALTYHFWIEDVCCEVFPDMAADMKRNLRLFEQCRELEEELLEAIKGCGQQ
ncbi:MAG: DUF5677 domain-containing protein [Chloroflexi bacterium]|nr:DUF5677 domain-containing protein [Chloroflexota bacterium]